jgi:formylglycine-generating enzyme required for sulfatase activity
LNAANDELIKVSKDFDKKRKETESIALENKQLESDMISLKEENLKLKFKLDSVSKSNIEIEMVFVEGGTFQMGSSSGSSDEQHFHSAAFEQPIHWVTLSSFSIGKYEVTQAQWKAIMGTNPSKFAGCDNCPVENVRWNDVQEFIRKLNAQTGKNFRMPTEAEWEYAAKGGKQSRGYTYSGSNDLGSVAWYYDNSQNKTHAVGGKQANELGIYDMSGNVWEWCSDWHGNYSSYSETNPTGASSGLNHVLRGGSWYMDANNCPTKNRFWGNIGNRYHHVGFRLVLPVVR